MDLYNSLIKETRELTDKLEAKVWDYDPRAAWPSHSSSELVLQKDAAYELGASGKVELKKSGNKLEVSLLSGELFFNVTEPLKRSCIQQNLILEPTS